MAIAAAVAGLVCACAGPQATAPRTASFQPEGDYRHVVAGLRFPPEIGAYRRTAVTAYDPDSREASAHYVLRGSGAGVASLYHYAAKPDGSFPSYADLSAEFEASRLGIEPLRGGAELLSEFDGDASVNGSSLRGRQATYRIDAGDGASQPLVSSLHLYVVGNGYLKYRFSHLERATAEISRLEREFLEAVRWPVPEGLSRAERLPACIELADSYETVARLDDLGLSHAEQIERVEAEVGDALEDRFLLAVLLNAVSVSRSFPDYTSFQIRDLVLEDCAEDEWGEVVLRTLWPWLR